MGSDEYSDALERVQAMERAAVARLRAVDEMKQSFLQAISHELRTPLTSLLGFAVTLERLEKEQVSLTRDEKLEMFGTLIDKAKHLNRLLGDLLDLDRMSDGLMKAHRRATDLRGLVMRVAEQVDLEGRTLTVEAQPVIVSVDGAKVERIVEGLLLNAAKYTPDDAKVWVRATLDAGGVILTVEDDGPGIQDDLKEACLRSFGQGAGVKAHSPGVGTGLTLVARFAGLHGGRCWIEDRVGGGTSLHVSLPTPERALSRQSNGAISGIGRS